MGSQIGVSLVRVRRREAILRRRTLTDRQWAIIEQRVRAGKATGIGHVIMDAAYDPDHPSAFIAGDQGAAAHIKRNPTRLEDRPIDWVLYKERHQME